MLFSKKIDILCIGGTSLDIMLTTDEYELVDTPEHVERQKLIGFEYGAKLIAQDACMTYGGGAANTAVNFAQLGLRTAICTAVGSDAPGRELAAYFEKKHINTDLLNHAAHEPTAVSVIVTPVGKSDHVAFVHRGANRDLQINASIFQKLQPQWLYITSLAGDTAMKNIQEIFAFQKKSNCAVAWNPGAAQLALGCEKLAAYMKQTTIFNVNKDEAIELVCGTGTDTDEIEVLLKTLHGYGPQIVVITCGADGAYVYDGEKIYTHTAVDATRSNTTGAGDAFGSTFVAEFYHNQDIESALSAGLANSSQVIQEVGAQRGLASWEKIDEVIAAHDLPARKK